MAETWDHLFGKQALVQKLLTHEQGKAVLRIQKVLAARGIAKSFANVAVEAGWMKADAAMKLIPIVEKHPPLSARSAGLVEEGQFQALAADRKKECEAIAAELAKVGFKRSPAAVALDKKYLKSGNTSVRMKPQSGPTTAVRSASGQSTAVRGRTGTNPAVRKPTGQTAAVGKKKNAKLIAIAAGGGGGLLVLVLVIALSGDKKKTEPRPEPKSQPAQASTKKKEEPKESEADKQRAREEAEWKEIEEKRKKFAEEEKKKEEERIKAEVEAQKKKEEDEKAEADAKNKAAKDLKEGYEARLKTRKADGVRRLDEARKALAAGKKEEEERQKQIADRLKGVPLTLTLKNGMRLDDATVLRITKDEVGLQFRYEGAQAEQAFSWEMMDNASYLRLVEAIHKPDGATGRYEIGRRCIMRKMWKEAVKAFEEAVKLDASLADRIPDLSKIMNNEGAFQGASKRIGKDGILVTYDFGDADQAGDFKPLSGVKMTVANNEASVGGKGAYLWSLKDFEFDKEIDVEMTVAPEGNAQVVFGLLFNWEQKGYYVVAGPNGTVFTRAEGAARAEFGKADYKFTTETKLRVLVKGGSFKVFANGSEVASSTDSNFTKGKLYLGGQGGSLKIKRLAIQGKADPVTIDRLFAEAEVLVRRALEGDLSRKDAAKSDEDPPLTVEDEYYFALLSDAERRDYESKRRTISVALATNKLMMDHLRLMDGFVVSASDFPAAYYWRGLMNMQAGRMEQAHNDFSTALRKAPEFVEAMNALGMKHLNEMNFKEARQYAEDALKHQPDLAEAWALKGFARFCLDDGNGAMEDLEIALKLDPTDSLAQEYHRNVVNVRKGPEHLGCKFVKEFPHYIVMTDISMEKTKLYGERLEAAYTYYAETFKEFFQDGGKRKKPRVAIFFTREAYLTYGELTLSRRQEWTLGYFHPMYKELLLFEDADLDETLQTLYHEAFHQFMSMMVARAPYWYNEGIAEYMGSIKIEKSKKGQMEIVSKANLLDGRLKVLKNNLRAALPFEQIMKQTPGEFYAGPVSFKYSQAWSMIHFFYQHEGGKYRTLIDAYYGKLLAGGTIVEAYDAAFGGQDMKKLQSEWLEYVKKLEPPKK